MLCCSCPWVKGCACCITGRHHQHSEAWVQHSGTWLHGSIKADTTVPPCGLYSACFSQHQHGTWRRAGQCRARAGTAYAQRACQHRAEHSRLHHACTCWSPACCPHGPAGQRQGSVPCCVTHCAALSTARVAAQLSTTTAKHSITQNSTAGSILHAVIGVRTQVPVHLSSPKTSTCCHCLPFCLRTGWSCRYQAVQVCQGRHQWQLEPGVISSAAALLRRQ
jgi:hypothetical protein